MGDEEVRSEQGVEDPLEVGDVASTSQSDLFADDVAARAAAALGGWEAGKSDLIKAHAAEMVDALTAAQAEVYGAKLPMASYGRVRDLFDKLKIQVTTTASDLVATELATWRALAIDTFTREHVEINKAYEARLLAKVSETRAEGEKLVQAAVQREQAADERARKAQEECDFMRSRCFGVRAPHFPTCYPLS